jgi:anti-sigma regulatory factor (Ser/Thr protein kinase)
MNPAAVKKESFPAKAYEPGEEDHAIEHDPNVVGIFDGSASPMKRVPEWQVRVPPGITTEKATARGMLSAEFYRHIALPGIDRVTEFGNLLVGSINALVNSSLRDRFSFRLKLCSACIVNSQQASTLAFVMSEILINALRYVHLTDGRIAIEIACSPDRAGKTTLNICDDGVGMPQDFEECFDARNVMAIRFRLQKIGARMDLGSDDLGLGYGIVLPPPVFQNAIFQTPLSNFQIGVH